MLYMSSSATRPYQRVNLGYGPLKIERSLGVFPQNNLRKLELVNVRKVEGCAMAMMLMSDPKIQHLSIRSCHVIHAGWKSLPTAIRNYRSRVHARNFGPRLQSLHLEDLYQRLTIDSTQAPRDWGVRYQASRMLCSEAEYQTFFSYTYPTLVVRCSPIPDNDPWMPCFKVLPRKPVSYTG